MLLPPFFSTFPPPSSPLPPPSLLPSPLSLPLPSPLPAYLVLRTSLGSYNFHSSGSSSHEVGGVVFTYSRGQGEVFEEEKLVSTGPLSIQVTIEVCKYQRNLSAWLHYSVIPTLNWHASTWKPNIFSWKPWQVEAIQKPQFQSLTVQQLSPRHCSPF